MDKQPNNNSLKNPEPSQPTTEPSAMAAGQLTEQSNVQYADNSKAQKGIGGWLSFWVVFFGFGALILLYILVFGFGMNVYLPTMFIIPCVIIAIGLVASIILIIMHKKIGKWISIATISAFVIPYGIGDSYTIWLAISRGDGFFALLPIMPLVMVVIPSILCILYFLKSKRVKATLVN
jgi:hypothetical protein